MLSRLLTRKEQTVLLAFAASICVGAAALYVHGGNAVPASDGDGVAAAPVAVPAVFERIDAPPAAPEVERFAPEETPLQVIAVAVEGAVRRPGVYRMAPEARVQDLIDMAGGATEDADLTDLNRAAPLIDGTTVTAPYRSEQRIEDGKLVLKRRASAAALNLPAYTISGSRQAHVVPLGGKAAATPASTQSDSTAAQQPGGALVNINRATAAELQALPGIGPTLAGRIVAQREFAPFQSAEDLMKVPGIGEKRLETLRPLVTVQP